MKKIIDSYNKKINCIRDKFNQKIKLDKFILIILAVYLGNLQLQHTTFNITELSMLIFKIIRYICYFLFFFMCFLNFNFSKKDWKLYLLTILVIIVTVFSKDVSLIILLVVYFACKKVDFNKIIKVYLYTSIITFAITILSSIFGIIPNWTFERSATHIRYSLGYQFCTFASTNFFFMTLARFYDCKGKFNNSESILTVIISVLLYILTDSRTGTILTIFIIFSSYLIKIFQHFKISKILKKHNKIIDKTATIVCKILIPSIVFLSIFSVIVYRNFNGNAFVDKLDNILSDRLHYTNLALEKYNITPFGQKIQWQGLGGYGYIVTEQFEYSFVDNAYINLMLNYGVVFLIVLIYVYSKRLYKAYLDKNYLLLYCLMLISLWAIIEPGLLALGKNIFVLIF